MRVVIVDDECAEKGCQRERAVRAETERDELRVALAEATDLLRMGDTAFENLRQLQRALDRERECAERAEAERDELSTLAIQRAAARNDAYALLRDARAERDELRAALQKIIDGTMDEYVERVARTVLARREGTDDEAR